MLTCNICKEILLDPRECLQCRANFCRSCVTARRNNGDATCPACEANMQTCKVHPFVLRELEKLKIDCPNKADGCVEKIPWKEFASHELECQFTVV